MERKPPYGKRIKDLSKIPKAPPLHEEPLRGINPSKIVCTLCGKTFSTKSALDRHMITEHELDEEKE